MSPLLFEHLKQASANRTALSYPQCKDWNAMEWGCCLAGEAGEACNKAKKRQLNNGATVEDIGKELADVVIYADLMASSLGLTLEDLVRNKFNEVSERIGSNIKL